MAPSTSGFGARSEPIASMAIVVGMLAYNVVTSTTGHEDPWLAGGFLLLDDFAALIVTALGAGAMWQLALVAIRTIRQRLCRQMIVGAALRRSGLRMPPFWIRHVKPRMTIALKPATGTLALQLVF